MLWTPSASSGCNRPLYFLHPGQSLKQLAITASPETPTRMYTAFVAVVPTPKTCSTTFKSNTPTSPQFRAPTTVSKQKTLQTKHCCPVMQYLPWLKSRSLGFRHIVPKNEALRNPPKQMEILLRSVLVGGALEDPSYACLASQRPKGLLRRRMNLD